MSAEVGRLSGKDLVVVSPLKSEPVPSERDPLAERIRELRAERDLLLAEFGDPDEAIDRFAEEFFDSDEAAEVLIEFVRRSVEGAGFAWDEDSPTNDEREGQEEGRGEGCG